MNLTAPRPWPSRLPSLSARPRQTVLTAAVRPAAPCKPSTSLPAADFQLDPCAFAIKHFQFQPDPKQTEVLTSGASRLLLCCIRQWGKSTTAATLAAHRAITKPGSLILCFAPTLRQSAEFVSKVRHFLEAADTKVQGGTLGMRLPNGSRLIGLPGKEANVRGFSAPSLIVIDEAARVPDELYQAIRPMLAVSQGDLALISTPFGERGFFWKEWISSEDNWHKIEVKATDCPRIPKTFLEEERRKQPKTWFEQEYLCSFTGSENIVFPDEWLDRAEKGGIGTFEAIKFDFSKYLR